MGFRIAAVVLVFVSLFSVSACGSEETSSPAPEAGVSVSDGAATWTMVAE